MKFHQNVAIFQKLTKNCQNILYNHKLRRILKQNLLEFEKNRAEKEAFFEGYLPPTPDTYTT